MSYDAFLNRELNNYLDGIDEAESFQEYLESEYVVLGEHDGEKVYLDGDEDAFKVGDEASWIEAGEDSEWEYTKNYLDKEQLIEMILELNGETK